VGGLVFHYYSHQVVKNLVSILNLLTKIGEELQKVNIILIEKAKLDKENTE
jgi:hypothetical protein